MDTLKSAEKPVCVWLASLTVALFALWCIFPNVAELASKCLDKEKGASGETTTEPKRKKKKKKTKSTDENDDPVKAEQKTKASDHTKLESNDSKNYETCEQKPETVDVTSSSSKSSDPCEPLKRDTCDLLISGKDNPQECDVMKTDSSVKQKTSDSVDNGSMEGEEKGCGLDVVTETAEVSKKEGDMPDSGNNKVKDVAKKKGKSGVANVTAEEDKRIDLGPDYSSDTKLLLLSEPESKGQPKGKEISADSSVVGGVDPPPDVTDTDHTFKSSTLPVSEPVSHDSARSVKPRVGGGADLVARVEPEVVKESLNDSGARKKLHNCGLCGRQEVSAKTFKRCQK